MKKDTDIDISIHLSYWNKLISIDFYKYELEKIRTINKKNLTAHGQSYHRTVF